MTYVEMILIQLMINKLDSMDEDYSIFSDTGDRLVIINLRYETNKWLK